MIWIDDGSLRLDDFGTFLFLYVGLIGLYAWRIGRLIRSQRIAEMVLRERIARHIGRATR